MFNLSGSELIFLVLIALVVLGPDKLPEAMRKAGKAYADFKKMTTGFQSEMKSVLEEPMRELRETAEMAKKSAMFEINSTPTEKPVSARMADKSPPAVGTVKNAPVTAAQAQVPSVTDRDSNDNDNDNDDGNDRDSNDGDSDSDSDDASTVGEVPA